LDKLKERLRFFHLIRAKNTRKDGEKELIKEILYLEQLIVRLGEQQCTQNNSDLTI